MSGPNEKQQNGNARLRRRQRNDIEKIHVERNSLEEYGYCFTGGKLVSIDGDKPFEFYVYPNDEDNQRRYHSIGRLVDKFVYDLLENECHLRRITIPVDAKNSEPTGFFFASDDLHKAEYLMIIMHGMGVVRAGQWSRRLVINENLTVGTQCQYIQRAIANGYAVIITNTNLNTDETSKSISSASRPIRGSRCAEEHACYIWQHFVLRCPARHICIMAHSYGGVVALELASHFPSDFDRRVFAVALTDSPLKTPAKRCSTDVLRIFQKRTINWIADTRPLNTDIMFRDYGRLRSAGHHLHEWTSHTAYSAIFKFFDEERRKLK